MTARIDHAAAASAIAADGPGGMENPYMVLAQVHATLALVEQQRIANILSAAHLPADVFDHHRMTEIREALGL